MSRSIDAVIVVTSRSTVDRIDAGISLRRNAIPRSPYASSRLTPAAAPICSRARWRRNSPTLLGQPVVADNRPGAGGNIGADIVAKSSADGYMILLAPVSPMAINVTLYGKKLPFHPEKHFAPITLVAKVPLVIVVNISSPAKTLQEFIALVKSRPGKMTYGSSGSGSSNHLTGAMLMSAAQLNMVHVPYKGGAPGMVALLSNEVGMMVAQIPSSNNSTPAGKCAHWQFRARSARRRCPMCQR